jgi:hypothetical protein
MDVVVWLRSLGLGKYEAAFRDNEIDETVLARSVTLRAADLADWWAYRGGEFFEELVGELLCCTVD